MASIRSTAELDQASCFRKITPLRFKPLTNRIGIIPKYLVIPAYNVGKIALLGILGK